MGKGDKKTKRGKIIMGSHGVRRSRRKLEIAIPLIALKEEKPAEPIKEKAPAKPKPVKEDVRVEAPKVAVTEEETEKPARKKAPPKGSARKEPTA